MQNYPSLPECWWYCFGGGPGATICVYTQPLVIDSDAQAGADPGGGGGGGGGSWGSWGSADPPFNWKRMTSLAQLILLSWKFVSIFYLLP